MAKPEDVLSKILTGELTREQAVSQHPDMEDRLLLLSELAEQLGDLPREKPSVDFRNAARLRLLQHIQANQRARQPWERLLDQVRGLPNWVLGAGAGVAAGGLLAASVGAASGGALPNDHLYPVKRLVERVQTAFAFGDEARASAYLMQADRRAAELAASADRLDQRQLGGLVTDYVDSLTGVGMTVRRMHLPPAALVTSVQARLASQATELEAKALSSGSDPAVQEQLTRAEVVASNVSDDVVVVAEAQAKPGPNDIRLAANPSAVATAVAQINQDGAPGAGVSKPAAAGTAPTLSTLNTLYDRAWNHVAGAPFMAHDVRLQLEQQIAGAKQDTKDGRLDQASSEIRSAQALLGEAVRASEATQYTSRQLDAELSSILTALSRYRAG